MRMKSVLLMLMLSFLPFSAEATPPENIELTYTLSTQTLTLDVKHKSLDSRGHHIRKIAIQVNGEEREPIYQHMQVQPGGFERDISLEAQKGDVISVTLYCSEGGTKAASLTVSDEAAPEEGKAPSMTAPATDRGY